MARKFTIDQLQQLLRKYQAGGGTPQERSIIEKWYQSLDEEGTAERDFPEAGALDSLKARMFEDISRKIDEAESSPRAKEGWRPAGIKLSLSTAAYLGRIAAVVILGIAVGLFIREKLVKEQVETRSGVALNNVPPIKEAATPSRIYLSDGSVVWLKQGSTLQYPETFAGRARIVTLEGEAFFDVAKDPERPFIIHSEGFTTRVVGTSFNIKAFSHDDAQEVLVVTGRVVVSVNDPTSDKVGELVLHPNQKAVYSRKDHSITGSAAAERERNVASDKRKLAFDEASLEDIIKVLNAAYGTRISVSSESMKHCKITADLTNESLEVDLEILSKAINATYTVNDKDIVLRGNGCGIQP